MSEIFLYDMRSWIIALCFGTIVSPVYQKSIRWDVTATPIVLGETTTLLCNTSAVNGEKSTWMKDFEIIMHQGVSANPFKYTENESNDGFSLSIMNTTWTDVNVSYTCLYFIYSYKNVLLATSENFIALPTRKNTKITRMSSSESFKVLITFEEVFPLPNCSLYRDNADLQISVNLSFTRKQWFYIGTIEIIHFFISTSCGFMSVICFVGILNVTLADKILINECIDKSDSLLSLYVAVAGFCCSVLAGVAGYLVCFWKRSKYKRTETAKEDKNRSSSSNYQEDVLVSPKIASKSKLENSKNEMELAELEPRKEKARKNVKLYVTRQQKKKKSKVIKI